MNAGVNLQQSIRIHVRMEVKDIAEIVWEQIKANDAKIEAAKAEA